MPRSANGRADERDAIRSRWSDGCVDLRRWPTVGVDGALRSSATDSLASLRATGQDDASIVGSMAGNIRQRLTERRQAVAQQRGERRGNVLAFGLVLALIAVWELVLGLHLNDAGWAYAFFVMLLAGSALQVRIFRQAKSRARARRR